MPLIRKNAGKDGGASSAPPSPMDEAAVLTALRQGSEDERWTAARAAAELPGGAKALGEALLREASPRVREALFTGLARIGSVESTEPLIALLRSDDARLRTGALDALRAMKGGAGPHAARLLRDPDADVRLLACELLRELPAEEASGLLCALLDAETEANVCASAVEVLAEVGGPEALPHLARCGERFRGAAFLEFALQLTSDRIRSQPPRRRG